MVRYPLINSDDFYKNISRIYREYKIHRSNKTEKELCYPKKYKLQKPQQFVAKYISPKTLYKNLLIFHQIGAGKTCASIQIAEEWKYKRKIIVAVPASLLINYKNELRSQCVGNIYLTEEERDLLKNNDPKSKIYKNIIKKSNKLINKYYIILSHQKLIGKIMNRSLRLSNKVLIIDEIQNLVSSSGNYYKYLYKFLNNVTDVPIILLSATPMFDKPNEIALTLNLLKLKTKIPVDKEFISTFLVKYQNKDGEILYDLQNSKLLTRLVKGYISYYRGANPKTFPKKNVFIVKCRMKELQYRSYLTVTDKKGSYRNADILDLSESFFIGVRAISNIAFPNKKIGTKGLDSFKGKYLKSTWLRQCSEKFYKIIQFTRKAIGTVFIYSNFKESAGIKAFKKVLDAYNYKDYKHHGIGHKRYAIWSGDENYNYKCNILNHFNHSDNKYGDNIKIFLGSPALKEGISLLRVEQVHIMEPYWNISRIDQVIGRAVRYCSHKDVNKSRKYVNIYMYHSVHKNIKPSIDSYIYELALKKQILINKFEKVLKQSAVDCKLNKVSNSDKKNKLICEK